MNKKTIIAGVALVTILGLVLTTVKSFGSLSGASRTASAIYSKARESGYKVRSEYTRGFLTEGRYTVITKTFYSGNDYLIAVGGCEDAYDVDVDIYDENGNHIDGDNDSTDLAVATFSPRWTGTYRIKVKMYSARGGGAHYVVQYAYR